jgi:hypothetical protein
MKKITLKVEDNVNEKFIWLLKHFSPGEISIVEIDEYLSDDDYLRSQEGMVESIKEARSEPLDNGVTLQDLDW